MLTYTSGDMFETPADARVNAVNCVGAMGRGVAAAFKMRYPNLFQAYLRKCRSGLRPGQCWVWEIPGLTVFNVATKDDWRKPSQYFMIEAGLANLREALLDRDCNTITLPALGCGNGGLAWSRVRSLIETYLGDLPAQIYVFEPEK